MLIFQHDILHEGSILEEGRKYAIRTDVMYTKNASTNNCWIMYYYIWCNLHILRHSVLCLMSRLPVLTCTITHVSIFCVYTCMSRLPVLICTITRFFILCICMSHLIACSYMYNKTCFYSLCTCMSRLPVLTCTVTRVSIFCVHVCPVCLFVSVWWLVLEPCITVTEHVRFWVSLLCLWYILYLNHAII